MSAVSVLCLRPRYVGGMWLEQEQEQEQEQ
jgi:hypothetical protein